MVLLVIAVIAGGIYYYKDTWNKEKPKATEGFQPNTTQIFQPPPVVVKEKGTTKYGIEPGNSKFITMSSQPSLYKELGARMVKLEANQNGALWSAIEPRNNEWHFDNLDYYINQWQKEGYEVVIVVGSDAPWAVKPVYRRDEFTRYGEKTSTAPINAAEYQEFLNTLFERYDKDGINDATVLINPIQYYQIEEEISTERNFQGTKQEYVEMLTTAYGVAKPNNVSIITGGINFFTMLDNTTEMQPYQIDDMLYTYNTTDSERALNFTHSVLSSGMYDIVRVNNFGDYTSIPNLKTYLTSTLVGYGNLGKQIWVTDYPAPFYDGVFPIPYSYKGFRVDRTIAFNVLSVTSSPEFNETNREYRIAQASSLVKKSLFYKVNGFDRVSFCCIQDSDLNTPYGLFGMIDGNSNKRLVYPTFLNMVRLLGEGEISMSAPNEDTLSISLPEGITVVLGKTIDLNTTNSRSISDAEWKAGETVWPD